VRSPLALAVLVLGVGLLSALVNARPPATLADPASPAPQGALAASRLLQAQGVQVHRTVTLTSAGQAPADSTLVVVGTERLTGAQARQLTRTRADIVLLTPPETVLDAVAGPLAIAQTDPPGGVRPPACPWPTAGRAGPAAVTGTSYRLTRPQPGAFVCYGLPARGAPEPAGAGGGAGPLVVLPQTLPDGGHRILTVLGDPTVLTNAALADEGNAALALGLLGRHARLTWLVAPPLPEAAGTGQTPLTALLGDPVRFGLVQLALAVVLLAAWRARQLGPPVLEPLPVVVPAAETTQGRARLYRATRARAQAADALRTATRARLSGKLGLPDTAAWDPSTVAWAAAAATGRDTRELSRLLGGGPDGVASVPADDQALIRLATELDRLEEEVRHGEHTAAALDRRS
jgi:hypothetical protein